MCSGNHHHHPQVIKVTKATAEGCKAEEIEVKDSPSKCSCGCHSHKD